MAPVSLRLAAVHPRPLLLRLRPKFSWPGQPHLLTRLRRIEPDQLGHCQRPLPETLGESPKGTRRSKVKGPTVGPVAAGSARPPSIPGGGAVGWAGSGGRASTAVRDSFVSTSPDAQQYTIAEPKAQ